MIRWYFLCCLSLGTFHVEAAEERIFEGRWNNRRTGSKGTMTCTASEVSSGNWTAVFRGAFQGKPFEYKVDFASKDSRAGSALTGTTSISGKRYQWSGSLNANQLRGEYQATNGWNGEFLLNETAASRRNMPTATEPESIEDVTIDPVINDGDHLLFVGNRFMADEGGVYNYLQTALGKRGMDVTHETEIAIGKPLRDMVTRQVGAAMMNPKVDAVVITSGNLKVMRQFATKLKGTGKRLIVLMTWAEKHPGNRATESQYTESQYTAETRKVVKVMRELEKDSDVTVIPTGVLFHDLTVRPPGGMPRVDYLWKERDIHQNALGTMANALLMSALLTGESPAGLNFDFPPHIVGQKLKDEPQLRLTRGLREALQYRAWSVAQSWVKGKSHLE